MSRNPGVVFPMELRLHRLQEPLLFFVKIILRFVGQHLDHIDSLPGQIQIHLSLVTVHFAHMNQGTACKGDEKGAEVDRCFGSHQKPLVVVRPHRLIMPGAIAKRGGGVVRAILKMMGLLMVLGLFSVPAHAGRTQMTAEDTYNLGQRYLKRGYYLKALEQFNRVRTYYRDDPFALKAEIAIADMHYQKNEWDAARIAYEDFLKAHPRSADLDYVLYRLGMTHFKKAPVIADRDQAWTKAAVNTWSTFTLRFPNSSHRPEVDKLLKKSRDRLARKEWIIARFYDKRHAPKAVEGRILNLLRLYPESPDVPRALALLGKAYAEEGNMEMAEAALQRLQEQYPGNTNITVLKREIARAQTKKPAETGASPEAPPPSPAPN